MFYQKIIRPILFLFPPELVHNLTLFILGIYSKLPFLRNNVFRLWNYSSPRLKQKLFGLYFRTPIGLSAGMDKNAKAANMWASFNFGWCQLGSITYSAQIGNEKPRLWRLPQDKSLVVNYGLSNIGAQAVYNRLKNQKKARGLWSISIAKSKKISMENAAEDYAQSFQILQSLGNIITINLSCPNVKRFSGLQSKKILEPILAKIQSININQKPIWLKIGNNLSLKELDDIIYLLKQYKIDGVVATNLSKDRNQVNLQSKNKNKPGSISGLPIKTQSNKIIAYLYKNSAQQFKIIGTGGIFTGQDAYDKIKAGASLLQIATGFIYGGPASIKKINQELDNLLKNDKFKHISEAVGIDSEKYDYE